MEKNNPNKIVIALLALIAVVLIYIGIKISGPGKQYENTAVQSGGYTQTKDNTNGADYIPVDDEEFMNQEAQWAHANNGLPVGWVQWTESMNGSSVKKFGPVLNGDSYMINFTAQEMMASGNRKCVGDSEVATCAVGDNPEILRYWNVINYFY